MVTPAARRGGRTTGNRPVLLATLNPLNYIKAFPFAQVFTAARSSSAVAALS